MRLYPAHFHRRWRASSRTPEPRPAWWPSPAPARRHKMDRVCSRFTSRPSSCASLSEARSSRPVTVKPKYTPGEEGHASPRCEAPYPSHAPGIICAGTSLFGGSCVSRLSSFARPSDRCTAGCYPGTRGADGHRRGNPCHGPGDGPGAHPCGAHKWTAPDSSEWPDPRWVGMGQQARRSADRRDWVAAPTPGRSPG